ncbi:protein SFI1 homolog [Sycon ciliatum]|uniref:protein SFI1 homolog n=1 Tax=Sycon ciliatum TaxID=27933 RepID=UPI0031F641BD
MEAKAKPKQRSKTSILRDLNKQVSLRAAAARKLQEQTLLSSVEQVSGTNSIKQGQSSRIPRPVRLGPSVSATREPTGTSIRNSRQDQLWRKYGQRWLKRVFGRVSPAHARYFYRRQLLKRSIEHRKDVWWESRREWRLIVRAECHNRYRLWRSVWLAWREYVALQRAEQSRLELATEHANASLMKMCWKGWRQFAAIRNTKKSIHQFCTAQADRASLSRSFLAWRTAYQRRLSHKHVQDQAGIHHGMVLKRRGWTRWLHTHDALQKCRGKALVVSNHHVTVLVAATLSAWQQYVLHRRQRQEEKVFAMTVWRNQVVSRALNTWFLAWRQRQVVAEHEEQICALGERAIKRRWFLQWQYAVAYREHKRQLVDRATDVFLVTLKRTALNHWVYYYRRQEAQRAAIDKATAFSNRQMLHRFWLKWLCRCESEEETRLVAATHRARTHRSKVMLRRCFRQLSDYAVYRRRRKAAYATADSHFAKRVLPKYFHQFQIYVHIQKQQAHRLLQAEDFRRENLLACFFYLWVSRAEQVSECQHTDHQAAEHHSSVLCVKYFGVWRDRYCKARQLLVLHERAVDEDEQRLCMWVLSTWRHALAERNHIQECTQKADMHHRRSTLSRPFQLWRQFIATKRGSYNRRQHAFQCWSLRKQRKAFEAWKTLFQARDAANQLALAYRQERSQKLLRNIVQLWHYWSRHKHNCHRMLNIGDNHHTSQLIAKVFVHWRNETQLATNARLVAHHRAEEAAELLKKGCQTRVLRAWHVLVRYRQRERWKHRLAKDMYCHVLLRKSLSAWRLFTKEQLSRKLSYQQALLHYASTLQQRSFNSWRHQVVVHDLERQKTVQALFFWSCCLRLKVLHAWRGYVLHRRERRRRYQQALVQHQNHLLTVGLVQWVAVGDDLARRRQEHVTAKHSKTAVLTLKCVWRCALHWRQWTRRRIQERCNTSQPPSVARGLNRNPLVRPHRVRFNTAPSPPPHRHLANIDVCRALHLDQDERKAIDQHTAQPHAVVAGLTTHPSMPSGRSAVEIFKQLVERRSSGSGLRTVPRQAVLASTRMPGVSAAANSEKGDESVQTKSTTSRVTSHSVMLSTAASPAIEQELLLLRPLARHDDLAQPSNVVAKDMPGPAASSVHTVHALRDPRPSHVACPGARSIPASSLYLPPPSAFVLDTTAALPVSSPAAHVSVQTSTRLTPAVIDCITVTPSTTGASSALLPPSAFT